jgi:hypothetical protein
LFDFRVFVRVSKPDFPRIFCSSFKLFEHQTVRSSRVHCIYINFRLKGHTMALMVSHQALIAEVQLQSCTSTREICGGQSGTGVGFSPSTSVIPCQYHSTNAPHSSSSPWCPSQNDKWAKHGNHQNTLLLQKHGSTWQKNSFTSG